jgi:hypothetical protein
MLCFLHQEIVEVLLAQDNDKTAVYELSVNNRKESE